MSKRRGNINRLGFVDIELRDETDITVFKQRGNNLGWGIRNFESFLKRKYGIRGFGFVDIEMRDETNMPVFKQRGNTLRIGIKNFEKFLDEKYGIRGFSLHEEKDQQKKVKEEKII